MVDFLVDTREPVDVRMVFLRICPKAKVTCLDQGDYETPKAIFERKNIGDLVQSIMSQRIFDQFERLQKYCENRNKIPFLLVIGDLEDLKTTLDKQLKERGVTINEEAVYGTIASIIVRHGGNLIWVTGRQEIPVYYPGTGTVYKVNPITLHTAFTIMYKTAEKLEEGKLLLPHTSMMYRHPDRQITAISQSLGVSFALAKRMKDKFGTYKRVMLADPKELAVIDGVGPATLQKLKDLLGE